MMEFINIHDLIKVQVESMEGKLNDIRREFAYFLTEGVSAPDIRLTIGEFEPDTSGCSVIEDKYYIKNNYIYYEDSEGNAEWKIELKNISDGVPHIRVASEIKGLKNRFLHQNFIAKDILLRLVEAILLRKGYVLLHSASVARKGNAYLFFGRGGSFKTTLVMDLIREYDFKFLGDDHVIVGDGRIYSFPENLDIFEFMLNNLETERSWSFFDKIRFGYRSFTDHPDWSVDIIDECEVVAGFNLSRSHIPTFSISEENHPFMKMEVNNQMEDFISLRKVNVSTGILTKCLLSRSIIDPYGKKIFKNELRSVLDSNLQGIPFYRLHLPTEYDKTYVEEIFSLLS